MARERPRVGRHSNSTYQVSDPQRADLPFPRRGAIRGHRVSDVTNGHAQTSACLGLGSVDVNPGR